MKKLIVLAVVLRLLVSAFYFHPDIKTFHFQASHLKRGVVNIYDYLVENKKNLPLKEEFVYFPLTYFALGGYQAIISPLLGSNFDAWLANADSNSFVRDGNIFKYLLLLKLPYIILDLTIAWLVAKMLGGEKGKKGALLWLFNPFTIVLFYVFGNVDIIPAALTLGAFFLMEKKRNFAGALILGLAAGFKLYPLLFIPFLFLKGQTTKEKLILSTTPLAVFFLISMPFFSQAFLDSALLSGLSTRIFNPGFNIGFSESIIVGLSAITLLFLYAAFFDKKPDLVKYWLSMFVLVFAFSHFHIQWLTWIAPFAVIAAVRHSITRWLVLAMSVIAFIIPVLYEDRFMNLGLLRAYSTLYDILPTPFAVMERFYDPFNFQSILHSILAAMVVVFVAVLLTRKEANE